jgi:hypothetical protein
MLGGKILFVDHWVGHREDNNGRLGNIGVYSSITSTIELTIRIPYVFAFAYVSIWQVW